MRPAALALVTLLAGCEAAGGWSKPGADNAAAEAAYAECHAAAMAVIGPETGIDQDIAATRGSDIQRSGVIRRDTQNIGEETRGRADRITASCMQGKGFGRPTPRSWWRF